jgi:hypothetical protein
VAYAPLNSTVRRHGYASVNFYGPKALAESPDASVARLVNVLERSEQFELALMKCFPDSDRMLVYPERQCGLSLASILLSLEHTSVLRSAFALAAPNSAAALLRLQFETLVRAAWLLFAATPEQIAKLDVALDQDSQKLAERLPRLHEMLAAVERDAPKGLSIPLTEFSSGHRQPLNSFVHGGLHALRRRQHGFPVDLAIQLVTMSNALMHLAYRILADLGGGERMGDVTNLYRPFGDCLPPMRWNDSGHAV